MEGDLIRFDIICQSGENLHENLRNASIEVASKEDTTNTKEKEKENITKENNNMNNNIINNSIKFKKIMFSDLPPQIINRSDEFEALVFAVNSTTDICGWIGELSEIKTRVEEITLRLSNCVANSTSVYFPVVGEVCAAFDKIYNEWYRIQILQVHPVNNTVVGKLIDYGNTFKIDCDYLAPLPDQSFCTVGAASIISLDDVDYKEVRLNILREKVILKKVRCTVSKFTNRYVVNKMVVIDTGEDICNCFSVETRTPKFELPLSEVNGNNTKEQDEKNKLFNLNVKDHRQRNEGNATMIRRCIDDINEVSRNDAIISKEEKPLAQMSPLEERDVNNNNESILLSSTHPLESNKGSNFPSSIRVPNECAIKVTFVQSQDSIYGRVFDADVAKAEAEMNVRIAEHCARFQADYIPSINELCCASFENDWCRAFIQEIKEDTAKVFFLDYGNSEEIAVNMLRSYPKEFLDLPSFAINFCLDVSALYSDRIETSILKKKVQNKIFRFHRVSETNKLTAKLFNKGKEDILNDPEFIVSSVIKIDNPQQEQKANIDNYSDSRCFSSSIPSGLHPLASVSLQMGVCTLTTQVTKLRVMHIISPYLIYGVSIDDDVVAEVNTMLTELSIECSNNSTNSFNIIKAGVLCACKGDNLSWQRGIVTEVTETQCTVFFIDIGSTNDVPLDSVKPLSSRFTNVYAQAIPMKLMTVKTLNGEKEWGQDTTNFLKGLLMGNVVRVLPKHKEDIVTNVKLKLHFSNLVVDKLLVDGGHAEMFKPLIPQDIIGCESLKSPNETFLLEKKLVYRVEPVKIGDSFYAKIECVPGPHMFFGRVHDDDKMKAIESMELDLNNGGGKIKEEVRIGQFCAIKSKARWCRGYVLDVNKTTKAYTIRLLDYGCREIVEQSNVKPLPKSMSLYPAQAFKMEINQLIPTNKMYSYCDVKKFRSLVLYRVMHIKVVGKNKDNHSVIITDPTSGIDITSLM